MIDGLNVAGQMITVAVIITADGTKVPVGLVLGDTENTVVVTDLLADLVARGLRYDHGILAVLDGSKALRKAVVKVFGERALIQRCTLHKRRNVIGYLPVDERDAIDRRLAAAFAQPDPAKGLQGLPGPRPPARRQASRRRRVAARRARGHVHRRRPRRHRPAAPVVDEHELHRVDDLDHPHHHRPGEALARRHDEEALDRRRACSKPNAPSVASRATPTCPAFVAAIARATTPAAVTPTNYAQVA